MSQEFETAALGSVGSLAENGQTNGAPSECRNCGEPVHRRYCGACGQLAQNFHKPLVNLIAEVLGDFFSLDGRVARTVPALLFSPGKITKSYLSGKRQRYVPPFRLYLLSSFIFFLALFSVGQSQHWFDFRLDIPPDASVLVTPDDTSSNDKADETTIPEVKQGEKNSPDSQTDETQHKVGDLLTENGRVNRKLLEQRIDESVEAEAPVKAFLKELANVGVDVYENPALFLSAMRNWAPRLALIMTPVMILCLVIVYPFRKGVYVYDHVITALHYQTWLYLFTTLVLGISLLGISAVWWVFLLVPPLYLYRMMRRVYASGRLLGLFRTFVVVFLLAVTLLIWLAVVFALSASETTEISRQLSQN